MAVKKILGTLLFAIFLLATVSAFTVTDTNPTDLTAQNSQIMAGVNAKLTDLTNQIESQRIDDLNFQRNAFMKSDLQGLYDNMVNINHQAEQSLILDNIVMFALAFAAFFLLVAKGMLPAHRKEDKLSTTKENLRLNKEIDKLKKTIEKTEAEKLRFAQKLNGEKKGWFRKSVKPVPSNTPQTLPPNPRFEALKKEATPIPQWQKEIIAAEARLELLKEQAKNNAILATKKFAEEEHLANLQAGNQP